MDAIKAELGRRWSGTGLLDVSKEADLRIGFTDAFATTASREAIDRDEVRRRLLLCLYGLGTNAGLKRLAVRRHGFSYKELLHTHRRYIDAESVRDAARRVANATLAVRNPRIWGEGRTACAMKDLKKARKPINARSADWPLWLGEAEGDVPALLRPLPEDVLRFWPIDKRVGSVRNDGPELIEPLTEPALALETPSEPNLL